MSRKIAAEAGVYGKIADVAGVSVKLLLGKMCLLNCCWGKCVCKTAAGEGVSVKLLLGKVCL